MATWVCLPRGDRDISLLGEFVFSLYGGKRKKLSVPDVNLLRLNKFKTLPGNDIRTLPPNKGAIVLQARRSWIRIYTSGFLWYEALEDFELPCPSKFAYIFLPEKGIFIPVWELSTSTVDIPTFVSTCSCGTKKCKNCKCAKANASCLAMCGCLRECVSG